MNSSASQPAAYQPLAARMRPQSLERYVGQNQILGPGKPLREAVLKGQLHSMVLWGPPGVGKTTLARLMAETAGVRWIAMSAVLSGVKDIRSAVETALKARDQGIKAVLFVDEVHRFNKAQQDAFLPFVEDGTIIFMGATTENPSFELNNALLSRVRVYALRPIGMDDLLRILDDALSDSVNGLGSKLIEIDTGLKERLAYAADGDGRRVLNLLEIAVDLADSGEESIQISDAVLDQVLSGSTRRFDKGGDLFYEQISALHKAVRGSSPDGALYWLMRMLDGGCDPLYIARRVVRMASEDIGNADPRGLQLALNAWEAQERLGSPEGELAIAQAVIYLACAPKSNAVYTAFKSARAAIVKGSTEEVPMHLRNAPSAMMKEMGYGEAYRYAHDEPDAYAAGESYLPEALAEASFYQPVPRGLEAKIREKMERLRARDRQSHWRRYAGDMEG